MLEREILNQNRNEVDKSPEVESVTHFSSSATLLELCIFAAAVV